MSEEIKGWKLVPVEPTEEMLEAVYRTAIIHQEFGVDPYVDNEAEVYAAMLSAAPEPSTSAAQQELLATTSVGMEPCAYEYINAAGQHYLGFGPVFRPHIPITLLYSAEQLATAVATECQRLDDANATLQNKLEQVEKDKAELIEICKEELQRERLTSYPLKFEFAKTRGFKDLDEVHTWMNKTNHNFFAAIAKYEVKKS